MKDNDADDLIERVIANGMSDDIRVAMENFADKELLRTSILYKIDFLSREYFDEEGLLKQKQVESLKKVLKYLKKLLREYLPEPLLRSLRQCFRDDFIKAKEKCPETITDEQFQRQKILFVRRWLSENIPDAPVLDDEQITAIAAVNGHVQAVARAGSGKTTVLAYRAFFLIRHCDVCPSEMLLLAFNRKAAREMLKKLLVLLISPEAKEAVEQKIGGSQNDSNDIKHIYGVASEFDIVLPHVMTFHALAYAIVHPEEEILYDAGDNEKLSLVVQDLVNAYLKKPEYGESIRKLMLAHYRKDWERIEGQRDDHGKEKLHKLRQSPIKKCLNGDYVRSYGEKVIANFLFEHNISYRYESRHDWYNGTPYRPDFTIYKTNNEYGGWIIEYFGLEGKPGYDEMTADKLRYWDNSKRKNNWKLIPLWPQDIEQNSEEAFREILKEKLEKHGVECTLLSEDEIWNKVRERAIYDFTKAMKVFIGRCRKQSLKPSDLAKLISRHKLLHIAEDIEYMFLKLGHDLYVAYLKHISENKEEDFDGLVQQAVNMINSGHTIFNRKNIGNGDLSKLRNIFIDEFQDFSDLFYRLLEAIRKANTAVEVFCVGDNWQAINGFAGSDLKFFENFEKYVDEAQRLYISTNYRSCREIVSSGNALMGGSGGKRARPHKSAELGRVLLADLSSFKSSAKENNDHPYDEITPAVLRIVNRVLQDGLDVVILCRKNKLPRYVCCNGGRTNECSVYLKLIIDILPEEFRERITISTTHKYKGLEQQAVIVLDAVENHYPLIHQDWIFTRIFGDSVEKIIEEERRLFYVALTRAVNTLVIFTEAEIKSPFLKELENYGITARIKWEDFLPMRGLSPSLVVKVGNQKDYGSSPTYNIKEDLKAAGYKGYKVWAKEYPCDGFNIEGLKSEAWACKADGIYVKIFDDTETSLKAHYLVNDGKWHRVRDT